MRGLRRVGRGAVLASLLIATPAGAASAPLTAAQLARLDLGTYPAPMAAPDFRLRAPDGQAVTLSALRGKVVLVNFWATWCRECRTEMPALEHLHQRFARRGLAVLGVNVREDARAVRGVARDLKLTFPLVRDPDGAVTGRYGVIGLPTTFLVGRDGRAVALAVGHREWASPAALDIAETLLAEPAGAGPERLR
jgi:peroxiredoxin